MTTPTQAQLDAARTAFLRVDGYGEHGNLDEAISAALTAAAQVERTGQEASDRATSSLDFSAAAQVKKVRPAGKWTPSSKDMVDVAAQVGPTVSEQIARDIRDGTFPQKSEATLKEEAIRRINKYEPAQVGEQNEYEAVIVEKVKIGLEVRRATIERCAQVALEQRCERNTPWDLACTTIAVAIRGLKNE